MNHRDATFLADLHKSTTAALYDKTWVKRPNPVWFEAQCNFRKTQCTGLSVHQETCTQNATKHISEEEINYVLIYEWF